LADKGFLSFLITLNCFFEVFDLLKKNTVCIDLGCGSGHIGMHLIRENVGCLIQLDMSEAMVRASKSAEENEVNL